MQAPSSQTNDLQFNSLPVVEQDMEILHGNSSVETVFCEQSMSIDSLPSMSTSIDGSLISPAFTSNSVARRWEWNHTGPDNTRLAVPVPVPREGIPERHQVDTLVTDDPQAPPLNIRSSFTSPHLRLVASCRNYFSRGRRALRGFSRPTSPTLDDNKQDYIVEHESFHSVNMASGVPMSLPLRRSVSSPCLVDQSRDTFAEIEMPSETTIIDSGPLMSTPPVMPSKKTLRINPVSSKSRPRSHHASTKSFSLRSGPFAKTDFFSLQRAVPNELTSDKRRSCSMGDDLHLGSQQQQVVGVIQPIAATMAPEILSWTFRHLMDRKSILNCGLVCRRWYGPAREELAHLLRDMPYNGQGLIQAIRTRFVSETLSTLSVFVFDKLLWNLAEVYYYSNPDTKAIFAPQYPPDMLYHLFWTFLFVDQEFRNPRTKSKVNSAYYIRLLQGEGCGYPKQHFHKKVFKNIFNDIRAKPLLPSPHLIQSLQALGDGHGGLGGATASSSLFMRFSGSLRIDDSLRRIRRWWRSMREIGSQINSGPALEGSGSSTSTINAMTRVSNFSNGGTCSSQDTSEVLRVSDIDSRLLDPKDLTKSSLSGSHQDSCGSRSTLSSPALHRSSLFNGSGSKSDVSTHHQHHLPFMNDGFTSVGFGWHPDGDGLDGVVKLPFSEKPSRLGDQHQIMKAASFVAEINHYEDVS